jgi:GntR family transcriptional regulator
MSSRRQFRCRLDPQSGVPVYRQIIDQVGGGVASGSLAVGDQLPTVRQLAVDLSINPNTVVRAYRELELNVVQVSADGALPSSDVARVINTIRSAGATVALDTPGV